MKHKGLTFKYDVGWDKMEEDADVFYTRVPSRDRMTIGYNGSNIIINGPDQSIKIIGESKMAAMGLAFIINDSLPSMVEENDMDLSIFSFSKNGKIEKCEWENNNVIKQFIEDYNNVIDTVRILG